VEAHYSPKSLGTVSLGKASLVSRVAFIVSGVKSSTILMRRID